MIKALVVDDERIVRQGLISLTDWTQFQIEFVAEAKDGMHALAVLKEQQVDLMFVDITMPNMNGFELIKHVQHRYPHIKFIMITCHHEFDDVKEALQLGVLDYIVKTLLDRENVVETMSRIKDRFDRELAVTQILPEIRYEGGVFYIISQPLKEDELTTLSNQYRTEFVTIKPGIYQAKTLITSSLLKLNISHYDSVGRWVSVSTLKTVNEAKLFLWLEKNIHTYLMYRPVTNVTTIDESILLDTAMINYDLQQIERWKHETLQNKWLIYSQDFLNWVSLTEDIKPSANELWQLVDRLYQNYVILIEWDIKIKQQLQLISLSTWQNVYGWCQQLSLYLKVRQDECSISQDVTVSLLKAIFYMKQKLSSDITQEEIAHMVNMSRSYFSQCFKRFYGKSFGDTLRQIRIEEAKHLLISSGLGIAEISQQVGFEDAKYFSRTFKQYVHLYPSEFRSSR